jgi:hypothetical protein
MSATKVPAKPGKLKPSDLHCAKPYMLMYSARVKPATDADQQILLGYISNYRATCQALYNLVRVLHADPANHLALYAVFLPAKVPEAIAQTRFWQENMVGNPTIKLQPLQKLRRQRRDTKKASATPKTWKDLNTQSTLALFKILADPQDATPRTRPGRIFKLMILEYGLRCPGLEARAPAFQEILKTIPNLGEERAIGNSVASIVRSSLSGMERAEEENRERAKVVQELDQGHPAFFTELRAWVEDTRVWVRSCRTFKELREQAKADIAARIQNS